MPFFGVPIRNGLPIGLGSVAGFGVQQFDPSQLFEGGTVAGAWYDPSDLSTMFDTSAGTTPVAMPGQGAPVPVGLMLDKSQGLVLGPELITPAANRDFSSDTGYWTKETGVTISGGTANWSATANSDLYRLNVLTVGKWYRITWTISSYTSGNFRLSVGGTTGAFRTAAGTYTETYYAASNGTFAITGQSSATGSIDNISVQELPGNHAISFNNTTARPELRARVNLLTYSEEFDNGAQWATTNTTITPNQTASPTGTLTADLLTDITGSASFLDFAVAARTYPAGIRTFSVAVKYNNNQWFRLSASDTGPNGFNAWFDIQNGQPGTTTVAGAATNTSSSITPLGNGWYRCSITFEIAGTTLNCFMIPVAGDGSNTRVLNSAAFIWGADLRPANIGANVPAYQRIADANTYDTSGFPLYLRFDGIDDSMYTPANLNLSGTDKVSVFAGVRKLSDVFSIVAELSSSVSANNGTFGLWPPGFSGNWAFASKGTTLREPTISLPAPNTSVLTGIGDISGDIATLRANGVASTNTGDQGAGNYGTYPLFIGARNNASSWLNGHLYSLIIAGSAVSAGNISATEQWVAGKTGLVLP